MGNNKKRVLTTSVVTEAPSPWEGALAYSVQRYGSESDRYQVDFPGPWDDEPDKIQWVDDATDLDCLMVRNHMGNWCGYVGVANGHPAYGVAYGDIEADVAVHGGLTFSDACSSESADGAPSAGICHVPLAGRPHEVWWHGFDCGHGFDFAPGMHAMEMRVMPDLLTKYGNNKPYDHERAQKGVGWTQVYRTMAYVRAEVTGLASQLSILPR